MMREIFSSLANDFDILNPKFPYPPNTITLYFFDDACSGGGDDDDDVCGDDVVDVEKFF